VALEGDETFGTNWKHTFNPCLGSPVYAVMTRVLAAGMNKRRITAFVLYSVSRDPYPGTILSSVACWWQVWYMGSHCDITELNTMEAHCAHVALSMMYI